MSGTVNSDPYAALKAVNTSTSTGARYGLYGKSYASSGAGVYGESVSSTGSSYGVWGKSASTEGRGVARLTNGEARIALDETFGWVTNPDIGLTAHLTPRGEWAELFVKSLTTEELVVAGREGTGDAMFDYMVYGLRIGFEEVSIVHEKQEESYIPSMHDHRNLYAKRPDLRKYNSLERFKNMHVAVGETAPLDMSASQMLRDRIEEYDPAVHGSVESDSIHEMRLRMDEERRLMEREQLQLEQEPTHEEIQQTRNAESQDLQ